MEKSKDIVSSLFLKNAYDAVQEIQHYFVRFLIQFCLFKEKFTLALLMIYPYHGIGLMVNRS
jgi:hypothetical protein